MQETVQKKTYNKIAGVLFLVLTICTIFNYVSYVNHNIELVEQCEESMEAMENRKYSYWFYEEAQGDYNNLQNNLAEYQELAGFGFDDIVRLMPIVGNAIIAAALLMKRKNLLLMIGFGLLTVLQLMYLGTPGDSKLSCILWLLVYCIMMLLPKLGEKAEKLWFIPAVGCGILSLWGAISAFPFVGVFFQQLFLGGIKTAALLFASLWIVYPDGLPESEFPEATGDGYRSIIKLLLLCVFTFGIYDFIWIYRTSKYLNRVNSETKQQPGHQVAACIFLGLFGYFHYWAYKNAQRVDTLAHEKGIQSNIAFMCLLFGPFFISSLIIQDRINTIVQIENGEIAAPAVPMTAAPTAVAYTPAVPAANNPDELPEL